MREPKVYFYKVTVDDGIAPCPQDGMLTLGVCKPAIRRTARAGDYLVGIGSNDWYPDKLIYVARVGDPIVGPDYYRRNGVYWDRRDCIYEHLSGSRYQWLNRGGRRVHDPARMPDQKNRDVGHCQGRSNAVVLPSTEFAYFGRDLAGHSAKVWECFPDVLAAVRPLQQSHLVNHAPAFARKAREFCEAVLLLYEGELDSSHHRPASHACHDNRGSCLDC